MDCLVFPFPREGGERRGRYRCSPPFDGRGQGRVDSVPLLITSRTASVFLSTSLFQNLKICLYILLALPLTIHGGRRQNCPEQGENTFTISEVLA
ncbi:MAG: hypothetical protein CVU57_28345 [Deltaproteobacteria bacterium HGW-Deltaproteobacteria-15]|nr:MAG: hypothetical protein CVU57_28345 [Deltaproteobacteria bacterium HGW-Deltaproteobacteria-15]